MQSKSLFEQLLIVVEVEAVVVDAASRTRSRTVLEKGRRFETVVGRRNERDVTVFHDAQVGVTYICPRAAVFVLSGRFCKSGGLGRNV